MRNSKKKIYIILIIALCLALAVFLIWYNSSRTAPEVPAQVTPRPVQTSADTGKFGLFQVESSISAEIIQEQLRDVGFLITEEYYFTEVVNYSSVKKLWNIELGITESAFLASYDGVVTAGIDFSSIQVEKSEDKKQITVTMPEAVVQNIDIDPESLQIYSEKTGLNNPISVDDYNASLLTLEEQAKEKALARGLLERANTNAEQLIRQFIGGLIDIGEYTIHFMDSK